MSAGLAMLAAAMQHVAQLDLTLVVHRLPFWFLVFSLFLPRIALLVAWFQGVLLPFHLQGIIPLLFWALLPRALVLFPMIRPPPAASTAPRTSSPRRPTATSACTSSSP